MVKTRNAAKPRPSISLIPLWLSPVNRSGTLRTREKGGKDVSDPPQNRGGHAALSTDGMLRTCLCTRPPMGVAHVLIYPCGKAQKTAPQERR